MKKILVGSPVRQKYQILTQFLQGLDEVDKTGFAVSYYFVDDNVDEKSTELLNEFAASREVIIKKGNELIKLDSFSSYISDEVTHTWDTSTIRKVAYFKDTIIEYALEKKYDYLFLVDSDIVVDRRTLQHLASRNVEIVSNVFWTQWKPNWQLEPQCFWIPALSRRDKSPFSPQSMSIDEARQIQKDFFAKMRVPGIYRVDGLGACTLIAYSALEKGVRFKEIPNLALLGEDRHFCVRAGALGIELFFDTVYPVYHIYREKYLDRVDEFKREGFKYDMCQTFVHETRNETSKIDEVKRIFKKVASYVGRKTISKICLKKNPPLIYKRNVNNNTIALLMLVRNENLKYFKDALYSICNFVDYYVIADTTTEGNVEQICGELLTGYSYTVIPMVDVNFHEEHLLYQRLWVESDKYNPGWILALDADEVIQEGGVDIIKYLIENISVDAYRFKRFDMWNKNEYRDDKLWNIHKGYMPYLMRYQSGFKYSWKLESDSKKFPDEISLVPYANINLKVKHYRWANAEDRKTEYKNYIGKNLDSIRQEGDKYDSLLDKSPVLKKYCDLSDEL